MDISTRFDVETCDGYGQFGPGVVVNDHTRIINGKRYQFTQVLYSDGAREYMVWTGLEAVKSFRSE